jgi:hypothetical protein
MGENQVDLKSLYPLANGAGTATVMENQPINCHAHRMFSNLYSMNGGMGILLYMSYICALPHQLFMHSSIFVICCRKVNSTSLPDAVISGMKHAWVQKPTLRILLCVQPYSCTITMGFTKN